MDKKLKKRLHELWQANARLWTQIWDGQAELMRLGKEIETIKRCKADDERLEALDEDVAVLYKQIDYARADLVARATALEQRIAKLELMMLTPTQIITIGDGTGTTEECLPELTDEQADQLLEVKSAGYDSAFRSWPVVMCEPESRPIEELQAQVEVLIEEVEMLKQAHFRSQGEL